MALNVNEVASRAAMQADANADFQTWSGMGGEGNKLFYGSRWSEGKRTVCGIARHEEFRRKTQGTSFAGNFSTAGENVIETDRVGLFLTLKFDPRVTGLGLDFDPSGGGLVNLAPFRVRVTLWSSLARDMVVIEKDGNVGTALWLGVLSNSPVPDIERAIFEVYRLDSGAPVVSKFGFNRLELVAQPFNPASPPLIA